MTQEQEQKRQEQRGLSEREVSTWQTFFRMQEVLRGRIEQQLQACSGLSTADYTVLVVLSGADDGRLRACHLGVLTGWEKSRLHHQLTRMSKRGLVERQSGEGRAAYVAVTQRGREALIEAAPQHSDHVRRLFIDCLSPQQLDQLADISTTVLANLQKPENAGGGCPDEE
ncbi:MarR family winged helix-turn-helix transcriptional regulator [Streptomyces sp. MA5143a]|uniref:MarR family winged helix-turn-helix transcriptional regulator n=1 Tax=Streptomyces sp. MA5143a TaxID=2083010 RepID=UPI002158D2BD|nr:MarR family winged helix-turn-helix transcriptional regulator [Streptomyces sp. MA5143a]